LLDEEEELGVEEGKLGVACWLEEGEDVIELDDIDDGAEEVEGGDVGELDAADDFGDVLVVEGEEEGVEDVGVVEDGDLVVEDGEEEEGVEDVGVVVEELEDGDEPEEDVGAAARRLVVDNKDRGPELSRTAERDTTITRDKIRDRLLIVTFVLLLSLSFFLSLFSSAVPAIC
jgi:hypothetical protein